MLVLADAEWRVGRVRVATMVCGSPKELWSSALFSFFALPIFPGRQENVDIIINGMG